MGFVAEGRPTIPETGERGFLEPLLSMEHFLDGEHLQCSLSA
jgi:hypothetical protein